MAPVGAFAEGAPNPGAMKFPGEQSRGCAVGAGGPVAEKARQADVHFRPAQRERRCGACVHFTVGPQGVACARVEGPIAPAMCCDLWRPLKQGSGLPRVAPGGPSDDPPVA